MLRARPRLVLRCAALAVLALALAPLHARDRPTAAADRAFDVTYLANEGFLIEGSGRRVLVDALFGAGIPGYAAVPRSLRSRLEAASGEFADVDLVLVTHYHGDHFDPDSLARFLAASPTTRVVAPPQAARRLLERLDDPAHERVRAVLPPAGEIERIHLDGITVEVLDLHHGPRTPPVENLGFVVALGAHRFLHFGDTEAKMEDFEPYLERLAGTDLALLPFWFLSSEWRAEMVRRQIRPRWIVAAHTPEPDAPASHFARWGSWSNLVRVMREAFPEARLPTEPGERYRFVAPLATTGEDARTGRGGRSGRPAAGGTPR